MFLILKEGKIGKLNRDYDSVPLKQLLCEDHEVWNWMRYHQDTLDEVSGYNKIKNKGKARRRAKEKELGRRQASGCHDGRGRSEVMEDLRGIR